MTSDNEDPQAILINNNFSYGLSTITDQISVKKDMTFNTDFSQIVYISANDSNFSMYTALMNADGNKVMIKMPKRNILKEEFENEVKIMLKLRHTNIIQLIGVGSSSSFMVLEVLSGGTLRDKLVNNIKPEALIPYLM